MQWIVLVTYAYSKTLSPDYRQNNSRNYMISLLCSEHKKVYTDGGLINTVLNSIYSINIINNLELNSCYLT
jgi:hypothetical protein